MDGGALDRIDTLDPLEDERIDTPDDYEALQLAHDELAPKASERAALSARLQRAAAKNAVAAEVNAVAKLLPGDLATFRRANQHWGRVFSILDKPTRDPLNAKKWRGGKVNRAKVASQKRFDSWDVDPERVEPLNPDHPALSEARTIFPTTVASPWDVDRLLVSGHNNRKLGSTVLKGEWKGFPIYHLTLEERASCPRSCQQWATCYGGGMHMARRHDHRGDNFLDFLRAELWMLARANRDGFVVRLHTLGDFYSMDYVAFWAEMIDTLPMLHVFGYTANLPNAEDPHEAQIGQALANLSVKCWPQFAMRFSGHAGMRGAIVIDNPADAGDALLCPAQHTTGEEARTDACSSCGLCWSATAEVRTIAFLRHGRKTRAAAEPEAADANP